MCLEYGFSFSLIKIIPKHLHKWPQQSPSDHLTFCELYLSFPSPTQLRDSKLHDLLKTPRKTQNTTNATWTTHKIMQIKYYSLIMLIKLFFIPLSNFKLRTEPHVECIQSHIHFPRTILITRS